MNKYFIASLCVHLSFFVALFLYARLSQKVVTPAASYMELVSLPAADPAPAIEEPEPEVPEPPEEDPEAISLDTVKKDNKEKKSSSSQSKKSSSSTLKTGPGKSSKKQELLPPPPDAIMTMPSEAPAGTGMTMNMGGYKSPLMDKYQGQVKAIIMRNFIVPLGTEVDRNPRVRFVINSNGTITNGQLMQSSGNDVIDEMAIRALRVRLPIIPPVYPHPTIEVEFTFEIPD